MAIRGGYQGKLLEVDLTRGEVRAIPLPPESVLRQWVGCTGLGLHLLAQEITPDMKHTDPECPQFILTGPFTGTLAPSSSNWTIVSLHTGIPYHVGIAQAHGHFGARLKHAGWDGIILRGASNSPVYLWIDEDKVEIRDATPYWGKDLYETTHQMQRAHRDMQNISVACIGPAGENDIAGASVRCDLAYGASKGGQGQIWGTKKLKAIAVRGTGKVPIANPELWTSVCEAWREKIYNLPDLGPNLDGRQYEGLRFMPPFAEVGMVPGKNFTDPEFALQWGRRMGQDLEKWKMSGLGSWQCDMKCHYECTITTGPMAGTKVVGYGGEIIEELGPNLGIEDAGVGLALVSIVDGYGLVADGVPRTIAMVMEAYNKGILTREDTDGIDLTWGNYEGVIELLRKTVYREGIGVTLAKGLRPAAQELGIPEEMCVHMKGVGFNDHDQRAWFDLIFQSQVASGAGPTWQVDVGAMQAGDPDLGYPAEPFDLSVPHPEWVYNSQIKKLWEDCVGVCMFVTSRGVWGCLDMVPRGIAAAVGWDDFSREEALLIGERIVNLQRLISLYRGYKPEHDFDISPRMLEPIPAGPAKGRCFGPHLPTMREDYYKYLNWDPQTGVPSPQALKKVGLAEYKVGKRR